MYKKQTLKHILPVFFIVAGLLAGLLTITLSLQVSAAEVDCTDIKTSVLPVECDPTKADAVERTAVWGLLILVINLLSAGVGILAVGGILYGSILYTTSSGDPEKSTKARKIIGNVVVGLIAYAMMWALLNFITPGGLFA